MEHYKNIQIYGISHDSYVTLAVSLLHRLTVQLTDYFQSCYQKGYCMHQDQLFMRKRKTKQNKEQKKSRFFKAMCLFSCKDKLLKKCAYLSNISESKSWRTWQNARALEITCQWYQRRMNNNGRKEKGHTPCHKNKQIILVFYMKSIWNNQ